MSEDSGTDAVDPETVDHVASLARIDLDSAERERFAGQFAAILEHFETLEEVPEVDSEPDLVNVLREDETRESLPRSAALANAAETEDGKFKGPNVS